MTEAQSGPIRNVLTEVVGHDLCIGCGLCAGICPADHLHVAFNGCGEYAPVGDEGRPCTRCHLCLRVCPFSDEPPDEDALARERFGDLPGVQHHPETGYYAAGVLGYSQVGGHREHGASGGLLTWTLETLLREAQVDQVVCVVPRGDRQRLFEFSACATAEEVRRGSRSCYYPVELSGAVRHMLTHEGRYAVTALPCYAKALRRAMGVNRRLRERVALVLGLVCGAYKSRFFTEHLCAFAGGDPNAIDEVTFRIADPKRTAKDYGVRFVCGRETGAPWEGVAFESDEPGHLWNNRYYTPKACFFCDDVFAECADATFMDAWLPGFLGDTRGHSLVLVRDGRLLERLRRGAEAGEVWLKDVAIDDIRQSQRGLIGNKRRTIREWTRVVEAEGGAVPRKRTHLFDAAPLPYWQRVAARYAWRLSRASRLGWPQCGKDLARFRRHMAPLAAKAAWARRLRIGLGNPGDAVGAVWRRLKALLGRR